MASLSQQLSAFAVPPPPPPAADVICEQPLTVQYDTLVKQVDEDVKVPRKRGEEVENNAFYRPEANEMQILTGLITGFFGKGLSLDLPR